MATTEQARTAVVLTALPVEFQAVREHMVDVTERIHPAGTMFYIGRLPGGPRWVALVEVGPGNRDAAVIAERAVSLLQPELLAFVGIAGGLQDDIALGEVVVPPQVHAYHGGLEDDDGFHARPRGGQVSSRLLQFAKHIARGDTWWKAVPGVSEPIGVRFRPIAAGDVVVNSRDSPTARLIRRHYNDAAAIEMESAGLANASQLNESIPFIVVRGISDAASGDKYATDRAGWQPRAARHAAAFAVALLTELPLVNTGPRMPSEQVVAPVNVAPVAAWQGGADVRVGEDEYVLVDDEHLLARTTADGAVIRQARGLRITSRSAPVWLRQVRARASTAELDALVAEHALRVDLPQDQGLPALAQFQRDERVATLVYGWPTSRSTGAPCETLEALAGGRLPMDRLRVRRLLTGMSGLCTTLAVLRDRGLAHRRLTPAGMIEHDDGTLSLRDLGLAARPYEAGEAPPDFGAPEQSRRSLHRPGPGTDGYQLGAVTYRLVTGQLPNPVHPLPLNHFRPDLPARCGAVVDAALSADPAARPDIRALGREFRAASRELG